ncbi:MAG: choice-of-anchor L domain-containing protein [Bacteroidota bacterium]
MKKLLFCLFFISSFAAQAQVTINSISDSAIANYLQGSGINISNLAINCDSQAYGQMTTAVSSFPMGDGLVLSTGIASQIANPSTFFASAMFGNAADQDISNSVGYQTYDACALEFDAIPTFGNIFFEYVWGSEEYPEFICNFNDAFLLLISGPGINGTYLNNATNIAILPDSSTIVSINTVHDNTVGTSCPTPFDSLYVDNSTDTTITFDGYTQLLTAGINLTAGATYHFKIVVADVMDGIFDSGVFLLQNSVRSMGVTNNAAMADLSSLVSVFPNPAQDGIFTIESDETLNMQSVEIFDLSGRSVPFSFSGIGNRMTLRLINPAKGFYHLKIGSLYKKISVE